jgi:endoglucanase
MKITQPRQRPPRRTLRRSFIPLLATALAATVPASAADWYLKLNQLTGSSWSTATDFNSAALGTGTNATAISANDTYHTNKYSLRTPALAGPVTFGGGTLRLSGGTGALLLYTTGTGGANIVKFESLGGKIQGSVSGAAVLNVTRFDNISGSTQLAAGSGQSIRLTANELVGSGDLQVAANATNSTVFLSLPDARRYLGQIRLTSGTLDFDTDVSSSGPLAIEGGKVKLDQNITVTALKIGGATLGTGTHNYNTLSTSYAAYFLAGGSGSITVKPPKTWYLGASQVNPQNWAETIYWKEFANGTGASPTEIRAADTFDTNGKALRTPYQNSAQPHEELFDGNLRITNPNTVVMVKADTLATTPRLHRLYTEGGKFEQGWNAGSRLRIDHWENQSPVTKETLLTAANGVTTGGYLLSVGKLTGSGNTRLSGGGATHYLTIDDAGSYTGDLILSGGKLNFDNPLRSAGRLVLSGTATVVLDQPVAFTDVLVNGARLPAGTHSFTSLNSHATYGSFFPSGTSQGFITIGEPLNWYLTQGQTNATDEWNILLHWSSTTTGTGPSPSSINMIDNFINQTSNRTLRAPITPSSFGGGALVLKSGGKLMVQTPATATTTVPMLETDAGATIYNGPIGIAQNLAIDYWNAKSGTTTLSTATNGAGGSFNLAMKDLVGPGGISVGAGSHVRVTLDHGNHYTGTLSVSGTGKLTIDSQFGIAGSLVVSTGGQVVLNNWTYVNGLTVGGIAKAKGIYAASDLAGFSSTNGSKIVVYTRDLVGPPQMFGVNMAGAEFDPEPYGIPQVNGAVWQYYKDKGLTLIRLPFRWYRIQPTLNSTSLNFTHLDQALAHAQTRGMKVILDMHSGGAHQGYHGAPKIGSTQVPISSFAFFWEQMAKKYKDHPAVIGYDLVNEPQLTETVLFDALQQAVNAIRRWDTTKFVYVENTNNSSSEHWIPPSPRVNIDIKDPVGRLVYSAHSYWDYQRNPYANPAYEANDGIYHSTDDPHDEIGVNDVRPFVEWLKTRPYAYGHVGEYAIPSNYHKEGWEEALRRFLQYLRDNNISGTYWAGGNNWTASDTVCNPQPDMNGPEKSQIFVLQEFNNN